MLTIRWEVMSSEACNSRSSSFISADTHFDEIDKIINSSDGKETYGKTQEHDILQEAIIYGNSNAISYLMMRNHPPSDYHPACNEYLHLACKLDNHVMVTMIIEARPKDFYLRGRVCYPNPCFHSISASSIRSDNSLEFGQLPIDIVTANNSIKCLLALLHGAYNQKNMCPAALLCELNHSAALSILVKDKLSKEDSKDAYHLCLRKKRHQCLEVILSTDHSAQDLWISGMNPYHFIYMYSSGYTTHPTRHDGLTETTQVLLNAGADICSYLPLCTYPLYSLLDLIFKDVGAYGEQYVSGSAASNQLLSCLQFILKQRCVSIDLNENTISLPKNETATYGRDVCSSAFDAVSSSIYKLLTVNLAASKVVKDTVNILLKYRVRSHQFRPSDMSGILEIMGRGRRSRSIQKNLEYVVYEYLWGGIDTSCPLPARDDGSITTQYLINQYAKSLCKGDQTSEGFTRQTLNENPAVKWIVNCMTYTAICTAGHINHNLVSANQSVFTPSLAKYVCGFPLLRLKTLAARVVWSNIGRQRDALKTLPIPNGIKNSFLDIIVKEI